MPTIAQRFNLDAETTTKGKKEVRNLAEFAAEKTEWDEFTEILYFKDGSILMFEFDENYCPTDSLVILA